MAIGGERGQRQRPPPETAQRQARAPDGHRLDDRAHARTIGQTGVDDRGGAVDAPAERSEDAFDHHGEVAGGDRAGARGRPAPIDPDLAAVVDEDLVDVVVDEQGVERSEAVEAGDRGAHEAFGGDRPGERGETADVGAHRGLGCSGLGGGRRAQGVHEALVDLRHRRPLRGEVQALGGARGKRATASPASTARAIAGSCSRRATTGTPSARSTSSGPSERHGSCTSTTPSARHPEATARASARKHGRMTSSTRAASGVVGAQAGRVAEAGVDDDVERVRRRQPPGELAPARRRRIDGPRCRGRSAASCGRPRRRGCRPPRRVHRTRTSRRGPARPAGRGRARPARRRRGRRARCHAWGGGRAGRRRPRCRCHP